MIIGVGLGRTGTASLSEALRLLGFRTHHGKGVLARAWEGDYRPVGKWDALVETPFTRAFSLADEMFPGSKFILTTRDMESWLASWKARQTPRKHRVERRYGRVNIFGAFKFNARLWKRIYTQHEMAVKHYFRDRPEDLLSIDMTQGSQWESLCGFLGRDVPDAEWPHLNRGRHANSHSSTDV